MFFEKLQQDIKDMAKELAQQNTMAKMRTKHESIEKGLGVGMMFFPFIFKYGKIEGTLN